MELVYELLFDNYHGENFYELYHKKDNAYKRFAELWKEAKQKEGFEGKKFQYCSFFDSDYNEYSTEITLTESTIESLFED